MFTLIFALMICVATVTACEGIRWYLHRMLDADASLPSGPMSVRPGAMPAEAELRVG